MASDDDQNTALPEREPRVWYAVRNGRGEIEKVPALELDAQLQLIRDWNAAAQQRWQERLASGKQQEGKPTQGDTP